MEFTLAVNIEATVDSLLEQVLARKARSSNSGAESPKDYVLKVSPTRLFACFALFWFV